MLRGYDFLAAIVAVPLLAGPALAAGPDILPLTGLAPLSAGDLTVGAAGLSLSAESTVTGSLNNSPSIVAGGMATGAIGGFSTDAGGGVTSVQLSTGLNNLQQNSIVVLMAVGS